MRFLFPIVIVAVPSACHPSELAPQQPDLTVPSDYREEYQRKPKAKLTSEQTWVLLAPYQKVEVLRPQ